MCRQLTLADYQVSTSRKKTRSERHLDKINKMVDWDKVSEHIAVVNYNGRQGGRKPKDLLQKAKMLFIQYLYNFSNPELEGQMNDNWCGYRLLNKHPRLYPLCGVLGST